MRRTRRLLFILADRLSLLARKGELIERYYNPGNCFGEVHLLSTSSDQIDPALLAGSVGEAEVFVHRLWKGMDLVNVALTPLLERIWVRRASKLAASIKPDMVRTGDRLTGYLGAAIKEELHIPHIVSLHTHRDDLCAHTRWGAHRCMMELEKRYATEAISRADAVIAVYESIREYARAHGARRIELIYNVVCPRRPPAKKAYRLSSPPRIVSVGRQLPRKSPENLIRAMPQVAGELTLIGDGACHARLEEIAAQCKVRHRVHFLRSVPNDELCGQLSGYDVFAAQTNYPEFPKTLMEAMWCGLPALINDDQSRPVPELRGDWVHTVANTATDYAEGLRKLLGDEARRAELGTRARRRAEQSFSPEIMEERLRRLYGEFLS